MKMLRKIAMVFILTALVVIPALPTIPVSAASPSANFYTTGIFADSIDVIAYVINDGGHPCNDAVLEVFYNGTMVGIDHETSLGLITGDSIVLTVSGLSPSTNYQYTCAVFSFEGFSASGYIGFTTLSGLSAPSITSSAATSITDTTATLNGNITNTGGATTEIRWGYGTSSKTAANFASYTTVTGWEGAYDYAEAVSKDITLLVAGTKYYFRVQAQNSEGVVTSTPELSFTTLRTPVILAVAASNISKTTARLNGTISNSGGENCTIQWGYGLVSKANFSGYDTYYPASPSGSFATGASVYLDITGLTANTPYYFRFQATNSIGSTTSSELTFTTLNLISDPTNLNGVPTSTSVKLTWTLGVGGSESMVRVGTDDYPDDIDVGELVYQGSATSCSHLNLTPGKVYYYSVWSLDGVDHSTNYATCMVTTNAGSTSTGGGANLTTPWRYLSAPNYQNLHNLPVVYDIVNGVADSINMPRATLWMIIALLSTAALGLWAYTGLGQAGRGPMSQIVGAVVGMCVLTFWWGVQIVPWFFILAYLLWMIPLIAANREI